MEYDNIFKKVKYVIETIDKYKYNKHKENISFDFFMETEIYLREIFLFIKKNKNSSTNFENKIKGNYSQVKLEYLQFCLFVADTLKGNLNNLKNYIINSTIDKLGILEYINVSDKLFKRFNIKVKNEIKNYYYNNKNKNFKFYVFNNFSSLVNKYEHNIIELLSKYMRKQNNIYSKISSIKQYFNDYNYKYCVMRGKYNQLSNKYKLLLLNNNKNKTLKITNINNFNFLNKKYLNNQKISYNKICSYDNRKANSINIVNGKQITYIKRTAKKLILYNNNNNNISINNCKKYNSLRIIANNKIIFCNKINNNYRITNNISKFKYGIKNVKNIIITNNLNKYNINNIENNTSINSVEILSSKNISIEKDMNNAFSIKNILNIKQITNPTNLSLLLSDKNLIKEKDIKTKNDFSSKKLEAIIGIQDYNIENYKLKINELTENIKKLEHDINLEKSINISLLREKSELKQQIETVFSNYDSLTKSDIYKSSLEYEKSNITKDFEARLYKLDLNANYLKNRIVELEAENKRVYSQNYNISKNIILFIKCVYPYLESKLTHILNNSISNNSVNEGLIFEFENKIEKIYSDMKDVNKLEDTNIFKLLYINIVTDFEKIKEENERLSYELGICQSIKKDYQLFTQIKQQIFEIIKKMIYLNRNKNKNKSEIKNILIILLRLLDIDNSELNNILKLTFN